MSKENEGKKEKKEVEWKPDEKITMTIKRGNEWKPDPKIMMKHQDSYEKKEEKKGE